jgi:hypothetical protein
MAQMNDRYAATAIEFHGRLRPSDGANRRGFIPTLSVTSTDSEVAEALREHLGVGKVDSFRPVGNPNLELHGWSTRG